MSYLDKVVYLTKDQYDTLADGGTVSTQGGVSQTGLKNNYIYITSDAVAFNEIEGLLQINQLPIMIGATSTTNGTAGGVPAPQAGEELSFLQGDGSWYNLNLRNGVGVGAILEGSAANANGAYSHAEGNGTQATGTYSHAEGQTSIASNTAAHAEGTSTTASGVASHAEGTGTTASNKSQHVMGEYNESDPSGALGSSRGQYVEIVGNGTSNSERSNARTLDWNGNEWLGGNLTVDGTLYASPPTLTLSLPMANWSDNTQTITAPGVTPVNLVVVGPAPANLIAYSDASIRCTAQGSGTLTFTAESAVTENITVQVIIYDSTGTITVTQNSITGALSIS